MAKVAIEAAERQAKQNEEMARLNRETAEGARRLVEADAEARMELTEMQHDLQAEQAEVQGSARKPYVLKNIGGVYSCSCPAWRNQSLAIERRTCKHLRQYRGEQAEQDRIGGLLPAKPAGSADSNTNAPPLLLAHRWENDVDLAGWWMNTSRRMRAFFSRIFARVLAICGKNWRGSSHWGAKD